MRILHVTGGDSTSGAAKGMLNLHHGLRRLGIGSCIAMAKTPPNHRDAISIEHTLGKYLAGKSFRLINRLRRVRYGISQDPTFTLYCHGHDLQPVAARMRPDLIHLHWPNMGIVDLRKLKHLGLPVVWTFRDMWPLTGGCHYTLGCRGYTAGCTECPRVSRHREDHFVSNLFAERRQIVSELKPALVAISPWLQARAQESPMFAGMEIRHIPNCISTEAFHPFDQKRARAQLGLPPERLVICIGAQLITAAYKGSALLHEIIHRLPADALLLIFGRQSSAVVASDRVRHLGYIASEEKLRLVYSASDIFLSTSQEEAFGKTIFEALACGTPAVMLRDSGPGSLLANSLPVETVPHHEAEDYVDAIMRLGKRIRRNPTELRRQCRSLSLAYDNMAIAAAYRDLYAHLLGSKAE